MNQVKLAEISTLTVNKYIFLFRKYLKFTFRCTEIALKFQN